MLALPQLAYSLQWQARGKTHTKIRKHGEQNENELVRGLRQI